MNSTEYTKLQNELTHLITEEKLKNKGLNAKERGAYVQAVLACKSIITHYKE